MYVDISSYTPEQQAQIKHFRSLHGMRTAEHDYVGYCCICGDPIESDSRFGELINTNYYGDVTSVRYTHLWH